MISMITTGGTIMSRLDESGVAIVGEAGEEEFKRIYEAYRGTNELPGLPAWEEMEHQQPYFIASEELSGEHLNLLYKTVDQELCKAACEGMIITHGSDTLAYSAAFLSQMFPHAHIPIVLLSANYPPQDGRSNGPDNFVCALRFIKEQRGKGMYVCNRNEGEEVRFHDARLVLQQLPFSDRIYSMKELYYGSYESMRGAYRDNPEYLSKAPRSGLIKRQQNKGCTVQPQAEKHKARQSDTAAASFNPLKKEAAAKIHWFKSYPGMNYKVPEEDGSVVLLEGYHSGTIAVRSAEKFLKECRAESISVFLTGLSREGTVYETIAAYRKLGINIMYDTTPLVAYFRLWLALSRGEELDTIIEDEI